MATKLTPLEVLQKRKREMSKNPCRDKRKAKGKNQYTVVVINCYEEMEELIAKGDTLSGIFRELQEREVFNEDAEISNFYRAALKERRRRNPAMVATVATTRSEPIATKSAAVTSQKSVATPAKVPVVKIPTATGGVAEGVEYERDGKRFTVLKGIEREVPDGYHVLRGAIVPKLVIEEPEDDHELPDYIKESMNASMRNRTVIEDAEKHERMVAEWKAQKEIEKTRRKGKTE